MNELSPCPNCGSEPDIVSAYSTFFIHCNACDHGLSVKSKSASGAMNAWNAATADGPTAQSGKTLRDEFAMAAYIDKPMIATILKENGVEDFSYQDFAELEARMRYIFADAMIKERNK